VSRRAVIGAAAQAATAFMIVPRYVLGGSGFLAPSDKINIACVGVGDQGFRVMLNFIGQPDVHVVSVCDVNQEGRNYPTAPNEYRERAQKLLGTGYSNWGEWLSSDVKLRVGRKDFSSCSVGGREPARRVVEAFYGAQTRSGRYRGCTAYNDFRELLERERDVDAVVVATPDHWHALISIAAMRKREHVFCQKPMAHSVYEARRMAEVAKETGVATQVAVGPQASDSTRLICEWIAAGGVGPVREVVNWSIRPVWPQPVERPTEVLSVPPGLDWDLWIGPSPYRPYHTAYLPFIWRAWYDFGTGAIGDMGCYSFETIFRALKLEAPDTVESSTTEIYEETYSAASIIHWRFPARGDVPPVHITWYDGGLKPPRPEDLPEEQALSPEGLMFIGDKATILCGFDGANPRIIPESRLKSWTPPPKTLPRSPGNEREWIDACKGENVVCGANFEYSAKITETILLGNVAQRVGKQVKWDCANLTVVDSAAAQTFIRPEYRGDWKW